MDRIPLKFHSTDTRFCRVYFKAPKGTLFCYQEDGPEGEFLLYMCTLPEGEPEFPVNADAYQTGPFPINCSLEERLFTWLNNLRLFAGVFPTGIGYADRYVEKNGDYKRLAFLPFRTLVLEMEKNTPPELEALIKKAASKIIAKRGEQFQISTAGQTVKLGE